MSCGRLSMIAALTLAVGGAALAGCEDSDPVPAATSAAPSAPATPARQWTGGYPSSIAVLGHSGSTGENSDPDQPGVEVRENSWATGGNPDVRSVYQRILERNPAIEGKAQSLSEAGANIDQVATQADTLLTSDPNPQLILIQVMDSDMTCPVERTALRDFRKRLTAILRKLAHGAPDSGMFVVSQFGSVPTYARILTREERAANGGTQPCEFLDPSGELVPKEVARLESAIHAYEAALETACKKVRRCTYDGGAFGNIVDRREYYSADLNHLSGRSGSVHGAVTRTLAPTEHCVELRSVTAADVARTLYIYDATSRTAED